ncbi:MAG: T9SS type A sorting domain-containing protein [Ignavibacteria bacterium]|jgi:hypothetical protein|nr:T9SS type A sorting domain-containing protein [Ignavibacteria bacterium]MCU7505026.1 T9SS type A sorting domain-containing protein [Ignavibacteria bacterium]MCU7515334.1 T9SS type A sorting domain-containing protein [Ignavibacteria bacterium]
MKTNLTIVLLSLLFLNMGLNAQIRINYINGTYISAQMYNESNYNEYKELLTELDSLGITKIIIQNIGSVDANGVPKEDVSQTLIENMINDAVVANPKMDIYLGLYTNNQQFWVQPVRNSLCQYGKEYVQKLTPETRNHLKGYYAPFEFGVAGEIGRDGNVGTPGADYTLADYNDILATYRQFDSTITYGTDKKFVISGYFDPLEGNRTSPRNPDEIGNSVATFLNGCHPDIFILQDGVGSFDTPILNENGFYLDDYLRKAKEAFNNAYINTPITFRTTEFWINTEIFQWSGIKHDKWESNFTGPVMVRQMNEQLYYDSRYATNEGIISWINQGNMTKHRIPWTWESTNARRFDSLGAVFLYKGYRAIYQGKGKYYDGTNDPLSMSYTFGTVKPSGDFLDPNTRKLLDGNFGQERVFADWYGDWMTKWVGFITPDSTVIPIDIIVDLKHSNQPVTDVSFMALSCSNPPLVYPDSFKVFVSDTISVITEPRNLLGTSAQMGYNTSLSNYKLLEYSDSISVPNNLGHSSRAMFFIDKDEPKKGQFVDIRIYPRKWSWLTLSEIEVFSSSLGGTLLKDKKNLQNGTSEAIPHENCLLPNYPNPFNPTTNIQYSIKENSHVILKVYNVLGKEIKTIVDEVQPAGSKIVTWNGTDNDGMVVPTGIYIYQIKAGNFVKAQKMLLMK